MIVPKHFPNSGFVFFKLNESQLWQVKQNIADIQADFNTATPWNSKLAGNLKHEYKLSDETTTDLERHLRPVVDSFENQFGVIQSEINSIMNRAELRLGVSWVNYQKKFEFNPVHNHDGVLSFALWIKLPYNIEEEKKVASSYGSNTPVPGHFQFIYNSAAGVQTMYDIPCDETMEGCGVLFPAKQLHCVYPFYTSDEYRISVSGNFYFKEAE